jgi:hypothetical protein
MASAQTRIAETVALFYTTDRTSDVRPTAEGGGVVDADVSGRNGRSRIQVRSRRAGRRCRTRSRECLEKVIHGPVS